MPATLEQELERRRPRRGAMTIEQILDAFAADQGEHLTSGPASEQELLRLERELRCPLPASFRALLARFGGGLFYTHEIFGARPAVIHDIELVPSVLAIRRTLGTTPSEGTIPFHRARGVIHLIDARPELGRDRVVSIPEAPPYPNVASFLETVVLPRTRRWGSSPDLLARSPLDLAGLI